MDTSSLVVDKAQQLAAAGRHAEVVSYLGARKGTELADSPSLALLYGTAQARLGRHEEGLRWVDLALDQAVATAEAAGDRTLWAQALRGRAEIRVVSGELELARRELDRVAEIRRGLVNPVVEAEDLRAVASLLVAEGDLVAGERALREVIGRAESHGRPYLLAEATRDLVKVLRRTGRTAEAQAAARTAKALFTRLGAEGDIRHLAAQDWDEDFAA